MRRPLIALIALTACADAAPTGLGLDAGEKLSASALVAGDLVITEVMQNPEAVSDTYGEWFELYNASGADVDLDGLVVADSDGNRFTVSGSVTVAAGDYAVFARVGDSASNGGVTADVDWPGRFSLGNGSDDLIIGINGTVIDQVAWDDGARFPDPTGASMSFEGDDASLNDDGAAWCLASSAYGDGDLGTPGAPNDPCTARLTVSDLGAGDLIISEIMQNPDAVADSAGEWLEIHNPLSQDVDLQGLVIDGGGRDEVTIAASVVVEAGGYAVIARSGSGNGGLNADYVWGSGLSLGNGADELHLIADGLTVDSVSWDGGAAFPDPTGASMSLGALDAARNDDGAAWCEAGVAYGDGDLGTPGAANASCGDADGDGFSVADGDCDDSDASSYPGAEELCDGVDNDCDGVTELRAPEDYSTISDAVSAAQDADLVCVGAGYWVESFDYGGKAITVRGAGVGVTRIEGGDVGPTVTFDAGEGEGSVLEALSLSYGTAQSGGALFIDGASPIIRDVGVDGSGCWGRSDCIGGAVYVEDGAPRFEDVVMSGNYTENSQGNLNTDRVYLGGLIALINSDATFTDVELSDNTVSPWDSSSVPTHVRGGVVYVDGGAPTFTRVHFTDNTIEGESWTAADVYGGVLFAENGADVTLQNVSFIENTVAGDQLYGGVIHTRTDARLSATNVAFYGNYADLSVQGVRGGVVELRMGSGDARFENVTFAGNFHRPVNNNSVDGEVLYYGCQNVLAGALELHNVVLYENSTRTQESFYGEGSYCATTASADYVYDYGNGSWSNWSPTVDSSDPLLSAVWYVNTLSLDDLRFDSGSPAINGGDPSLLDADGSVSDPGVFGGPLGESW